MAATNCWNWDIKGVQMKMKLKSETAEQRIWKVMVFGNDKAQSMTASISGSQGER